MPLNDRMPFESRALPKIGPLLVVTLDVRVWALTVRSRAARANEREAFMITTNYWRMRQRIGRLVREAELLVRPPDWSKRFSSVL